MKEDVICGVCGAVADMACESLGGYVQGTEFVVYHCPSCSAAFARPEVDTEPIYESIYRHADTVPGYSRYWTYARDIRDQADPLGFLASREEAYWAVARVLGSRPRAPGQSLRVLDGGCGMGYLTHAIQRGGYEVVGCDASPRAIAHARTYFDGSYEVAGIDCLARKQTDSFDVVLLVEVVEHAFDPAALIRDAVALVRPGGVLVVTTPNRSLYPTRILWQTELPPVHYWWFAEASVAALAETVGCRMGLLDFSEYYRTHPVAVSVRRLSESPSCRPVLAADGTVMVRPTASTAGGPERPLRRQLQCIARIPVVRRILDRVRGYRRCGSQGIVMCAVLEKPA